MLVVKTKILKLSEIITLGCSPLYVNPALISHCPSHCFNIISSSFHHKGLKVGVLFVHPNPYSVISHQLALGDIETGQFISNQNNYPFNTHLHTLIFGQMKTGCNIAVSATLHTHEIVPVKRLPGILLITYIWKPAYETGPKTLACLCCHSGKAYGWHVVLHLLPQAGDGDLELYSN